MLQCTAAETSDNLVGDIRQMRLVEKLQGKSLISPQLQSNSLARSTEDKTAVVVVVTLLLLLRGRSGTYHGGSLLPVLFLGYR
jgi:hypothetical protein